MRRNIHYMDNLSGAEGGGSSYNNSTAGVSVLKAGWLIQIESMDTSVLNVVAVLKRWPSPAGPTESGTCVRPRPNRCHYLIVINDWEDGTCNYEHLLWTRFAMCTMSYINCSLSPAQFPAPHFGQLQNDQLSLDDAPHSRPLVTSVSIGFVSTQRWLVKTRNWTQSIKYSKQCSSLLSSTVHLTGFVSSWKISTIAETRPSKFFDAVIKQSLKNLNNIQENHFVEGIYQIV